MAGLGGLPRPLVTEDDAARIAVAHWGLTGAIRELGSNQDRNFRIDDSSGRVVLKIANPAWERAELEAQRAALSTIEAAALRGPLPVDDLQQVEVDGQHLLAHVLTYVDGTPLLDRARFGLDECRLLGETAGRVVAALADFRHPGTERRSQWDLRAAAEVLDSLDPSLAERVSDAAARIADVADELPLQVIHGDLTDDNVVLTDSGAAGVIDFGDLAVSWRCAELAVAAASVLGKTADDVRAVLAVVEGFAAHTQLSDTELGAVWPLVVVRGAVLVASAADQTVLDGDNGYAEARASAEVDGFEASLALDLEEMTWLVRGVGQPLGAPRLVGPVPGMRFRTADLSVTAEVWDRGAWLTGSPALPPVLATRYGEYRLDRAQPLSRRHSQPTLSLAGEIDGQVIQACTLPGMPPRFVRPHAVDVWQRICPDPSPFLSTDIAAPTADPRGLLERRDAHFAGVQEHYYADPPQIERGWREFLIDTQANVYVDVVNNVATTGHAHPVLTRAATRQWNLLNTNSRFHYAASVELSERLAALAPDGLDQVFLVNSGSEAVDLALRLAMTATGRDRILAAREAYHGWTIGSDAVTSSLGDNPRALETRPAWVELIDAPNQIRGTHRGPGAAAGYLRDLDAQLAGLDRDRIAGVILEPIFGNGGGVLLPDGYLAGVFDRVRGLGGVCISDEVQMGYGRLGHHFWGFEQQDAVPDIITVAKAMGNGQPLGAVLTTRPIAEAFAAEGSFFSSAGGSPVSAALGLAVLDVMEAERLQENARVVGDHLKAALEQLGTTYDVIGAVHGMGLYLGVELVLDRATFEPATELTAQICDALLEEGCIVQPTGDHKNVLKIKPPLVITRESVDYVVGALDRVLGRLS
ncbi:aminotransferase class III-fold pyridoxal phosphate-dependent enzyme [Nocardioides sp. Kera G14]|uniref:aminotransferase class III-fold pyridoxal phosphate-dependent enzyme n=1 Tax=Nocardioides sp. Kera G14 TaxID=2884264 RepID=UPI001D126F51|nr:aminotransferase class III-fold pyridoxal phosphate-dependent enzyme [Nocardioides sp. Kera G14]UDY25087.1 aminotransferase class III-fold pyridoxal phosphate-dependent enzyme [Nocardioides sp. Kera G14]